MINVKEIYDDVALDSANTAENGQLGFDMFNRISKRAELRLLDFLTSDINNQVMPMLGNSQKNNDWIAFLITPFKAQAIDGVVTRPDNYYAYESMELLGNYANQPDCEDDDSEITQGCNIPIELLQSSQFSQRCTSFIEGLKPSFTKPIVKQVGKNFEFMPADIGSVKLQYIRYPKFAKIVSKLDPVYNEEIVDESLSTNYEYDESARELLVYWITQEYAVHTREQALLQSNQLQAVPQPRG